MFAVTEWLVFTDWYRNVVTLAVGQLLVEFHFEGAVESLEGTVALLFECFRRTAPELLQLSPTHTVMMDAVENIWESTRTSGSEAQSHLWRQCLKLSQPHKASA